jgi:transcriptional repressor NrdR
MTCPGKMQKKLSAYALINRNEALKNAILPLPPVTGGSFLSPLLLRFPLAFYIALCQYIDMFCINCFNPNTAVTNSRPNKKQPSVWRRRKCPKCGTIYTTYERPSLADNSPVHLRSGKTEGFNLGKLILSVARAFTHSPVDAEYNALWLAQTIEDTLSSQRELITPEDIEATTHDTLRHFDELAAMQYAAQHQMIVTTRRRGRPSWHEREQPKRESPSL